ncbi:hypothetical protein RJ640_024459 [Escallonia rubra]|uniref:Leucine-rich repeat-containing N-terminal plant-type domain-containing protein n=1 Tax=Escallonia rubra TaxID=112253 RepID=A0AA88R6Q7_9ASTE|nr:hypothetical protein RJ640_024459 [Escallonia rubra]
MAALVFFALIMSFSAVSAVTNITSDEHALLSLKSPLTNWSSSVTHVCNWTGVICNRYGRVAALDLSNMGLLGTIPPSMGNLSFLVSLDFSNNSFSGNIPKEMAHLRRIKEINLSFNDFSGGLPTYYSRIDLQHIYTANPVNSIQSTLGSTAVVYEPSASQP